MPSQEEIDRMSEMLKEAEARYLEKRNLEVEINNQKYKERIKELENKTALEKQNELKTALGLKLTENGHPLESILLDCLYQVTGGKGDERHGNGRDFMDQPWKHIADIHGVGFLTGQAAKKLDEAQGFDDLDKWLREMYGVITYSAMAILYRTKFEDEF